MRMIKSDIPMLIRNNELEMYDSLSSFSGTLLGEEWLSLGILSKIQDILMH